jgi:hypothetical protein
MSNLGPAVLIGHAHSGDQPAFIPAADCLLGTAELVGDLPRCPPQLPVDEDHATTLRTIAAHGHA